MTKRYAFQLENAALVKRNAFLVGDGTIAKSYGFRLEEAKTSCSDHGLKAQVIICHTSEDGKTFRYQFAVQADENAEAGRWNVSIEWVDRQPDDGDLRAAMEAYIAGLVHEVLQDVFGGA